MSYNSRRLIWIVVAVVVSAIVREIIKWLR